MKRTRKVLISLWIITLLLCVVISSWPYPSPTRKILQKYTCKITWFLGLNQAWAMFAPNPTDENIIIKAEVDFKDGDKKFLQIPRIEKSKDSKEINKIIKYNIWLTISIVGGKRVEQYHNACSFIAREVYNDKANPPVCVTLWKLWLPVIHPNEKWVGMKENQATAEEEMYTKVLCKEKIKPEDLW
jgi:hypothetical protein